jgi:hypothetical protein
MIGHHYPLGGSQFWKDVSPSQARRTKRAILTEDTQIAQVYTTANFTKP